MPLTLANADGVAFFLFTPLAAGPVDCDPADGDGSGGAEGAGGQHARGAGGVGAVGDVPRAAGVWSCVHACMPFLCVCVRALSVCVYVLCTRQACAQMCVCVCAERAHSGWQVWHTQTGAVVSRRPALWCSAQHHLSFVRNRHPQ